MSQSLKSSLQQLIAGRGPIPIATYMQMCLTHPTEGYYVTRDPLGARGDFTTSPEISQMFGELIGINILMQWMAQGRPKSVRLAELGPGRGTLMSDVMRTIKTFKPFHNSIAQIALVEASPELRKKQENALMPYRDGISVDWHSFAKEIPSDGVPTYLVAHEFFDALPIHQFTKLANGTQWVERLVGIDEKSGKFRFVESPNAPSKVMSAVLQAQPRFKRLPPNSEIELSPLSLEIAQDVGRMLKRNTGGALIIDYGPSSTIPVNTFRAFQSHHQITPLETEPGEADLTADVDFRGLANVFEKNGLRVFGPARQRDWLHRMGIGARATVLANNQDAEGKKRVEQAYARLTDAGGMGKTYKFMGVSTGDMDETFARLFDPTPEKL